MGKVHSFSTYPEDEALLKKIRTLYPVMGTSRLYCMIFKEWFEGLAPERIKELLNTDWSKRKKDLEDHDI